MDNRRAPGPSAEGNKGPRRERKARPGTVGEAIIRDAYLAPNPKVWKGPGWGLPGPGPEGMVAEGPRVENRVRDIRTRPRARLVAHEEGRGNALRIPSPTRILAKEQAGATRGVEFRELPF
jgi:hypothetical protein